MRIFQVNSVCGTGSTGRIALDLKRFAEQNGHECQIAYGRGFCNEPGCIKIANQPEFYLHTALSRITDRQGFYSKAATRRLIRAIQAFLPDVIHLHNIHGYYLNLPLLFNFLKAYEKPVVWTLHDCWAFTGHCAYYSYAGCDKWKTACQNCPQKGEYPASKLLDRSAKNFAQKKQLFTALKNLTLATPSAWLAEQVKYSFLNKYPVQVLPNGIDLKAFKPTTGNFVKPLGLNGQKIVLGVANIWEPRKGLPDFLKLASLLPDEYRVVLVGLSAEQCRTLPKNIVGLTRTDNIQQLAELYTAAAVYVNFSVEETMGLTTVEAMACGTPVVTYDQTAVPEVVDSNCGKVVPAGNIEEACRAVEMYSAQDLSTVCIEKAAQFEKELKYSEYLKLYQSVVSFKND